MIPCKECLKHPICIRREEIDCHDLITWIMEYHKKDHEKFVKRLISYEALVNKEVSVVVEESLILQFKKGKDHHSCMIATNY